MFDFLYARGFAGLSHRTTESLVVYLEEGGSVKSFTDTALCEALLALDGRDQASIVVVELVSRFADSARFGK